MASETRAAFDETKPPETDSNTGAYEDEPESPRAEPDYYALLGVAPDASHDEIHRAFRHLAKLWHPDRFTSAPPALRERAERRMRAVIRARDALADPISRHEYDARRSGLHGEPGLSPEARPYPMPSAPPPPFFGAGSLAHYERRTPNPNGAGQFFGVLTLILALGLGASAFNGRFGDGTGSLVAFAVILGLFLLAGVLFSEGSTLARAATHLLEADPAPPRPRHTPARARARHAGRRAAGKRHKPYSSTVHRRVPRPDEVEYDTGDRDTSARADETSEETTFDEEQPGDATFDELVKQALDGVPDEFQPWLENVVVRVVREPSRQQLHEMEVRPDCTLLGLYVGVPVTHHAHFTGQGAPPEIITIFQGPIERYARHDPERVTEQVRRTVLHELAHHFGMSHEAMPAWIR